MAKYRLTFTDGEKRDVSKADVDEENRVVKQVADTPADMPFKYHYYPFESLVSIHYLGED